MNNQAQGEGKTREKEELDEARASSVIKESLQ